MASYTSSLRLVQPSVGEYPGTWGTQVNDGLTALVDTSVAGTATITMAAANYTLSTANGATDEARALVLNLTGTPGAARNVICPAVSKVYIVYNNTTGGFAQTIKTASGSGVSIPNGYALTVRCDGTDVVAVGTVDSAMPFLQSGTGAVTRTAQSKMRDVVSVKDFGAVGDGVTNDTTAITNAFVAAKGKALYFPAGTYLTGTITLDNTYTNMFVYGDGAASILKLVGSSTTAILRLRQSSNISFTQMKFDGNGAAQSSTGTYCVYLDRAATNIKFNDVWFFNSYDDNVFLTYTTSFGAVSNVSFTDCRFQTTTTAGNANAKLLNTENITFQGCYFTDWTLVSIDINFFSPAVNGGLIVDSCYFQNTNSDAFCISAVAGDMVPNDNFYRIKNVVVSNNIFDANNRATLGSSGINGWMDYVSITGNTWRRSDSGSWRQGMLIAGNYVTISNNVLDDGQIALTNNSVASAGKNNIITNNSIRVNGGSSLYGIQVGGSAPDGVITYDRLIVSNNTIDLIGVTGPNSGAIHFGTFEFTAVVKNSVCSNNTMSHDSAVSAVNGIRFTVASGSQNINIINNSIVNADTGIQCISAVATDVEISGNDLRGCNSNISLPATGIYRVFGNTFNATYQLVSSDRGDASVTVVNGVDAPTQVFNTPLTTNRTVTLSSTDAFAGATFTVVRTAAATGASTLDVGGLKTLAAGQTCTVQYSGTAWFLLSFGSL